MAGISFTEGSGVNDSVFGKCQAPIRMFIEKRLGLVLIVGTVVLIGGFAAIKYL